MKNVFALLAAVCSLALFAAQDELPKIRRTDKVPFNNKGQILPALWKKADTLGRFSIPGQATVAVNQTEVQLLYDKENLYISIRGKRVGQKQRDP